MFDTTPALQRLDLSGNSLAGAIPPSVSSHAVLTHLYLSDNAFDGTFPPLPATVLVGADATDGTSVDFTDSGSFRCPLPENESAYSTATCECGPGFAGPERGQVYMRRVRPRDVRGRRGDGRVRRVPRGVLRQRDGRDIVRRVPTGVLR